MASFGDYPRHIVKLLCNSNFTDIWRKEITPNRARRCIGTVHVAISERSDMARATGGRVGRHLRRSQALPINPAPPGGGGGQYKPLSISDMEQIYKIALRLLEDLGVVRCRAACAISLCSRGRDLKLGGSISHVV